MAVLITVLTCPCPPFTSLMLCWEQGRRFLSPEGGRASPHMAWAGPYYPCYGHWAGLLPPGMWCLARQQALRLHSLLSHTINFFVPSELAFFFRGKSSELHSCRRGFSSCPGSSTNASAKPESPRLLFEGASRSPKQKSQGSNLPPP